MSATALARSSGRLLLRSTRHPQNTFSARIIPSASLPRLPSLIALARHYADKSFPPHTVITMPALSPTMQAGNIGTWQKQVGDSLSPGDVLVEVETDKAQMDFEFQDEGLLAKILKQTGEKDVSVGTPIAVMVEEGEDVKAFEEFTVEDAGGEKAAPKKEQKQEGESKESESKEAQEQPKQEQEDSQPAPQAEESQPTGEFLQPSLDREKAAPSVKRLAKEKGVAISQIKGSGPNGQVTKSDVENFQPAGSGGAPAPTPAAAAEATYEDTAPSSMRKVIASRLKQSMNENPHYFVSSPVSVSKLLKLRAALNASADGAYKLSLNDFLVKAVAVAARKVPAANSHWHEEGGDVFIRQHNVVDVSVAVATPVGLMTPIVKNVNSLGLESISNSIKELGKRARDGKLKPDEYQGGTITISNMGMNPAVERFTAVINPPQSTILAVGTVRKVAVPAVVPEGEEGAPVGVEWDDQIVVQASFDHKVVDGAVGGEWMREFKKAVENPLELLL